MTIESIAGYFCITCIVASVIYTLLGPIVTKHLLPFTVGGESYRFKGLKALDWETLSELLKTAATESLTYTAWIFEVMVKKSEEHRLKSTDHPALPAITVLAAALEPVPDDKAGEILKETFAQLKDLDTLAAQLKDCRLLFLVGRTYLLEANTYRKGKGSNETTFTKNRDISLKFLNRARQLTGEQKGDTARTYASSIGSSYETALYLKFRTPPTHKAGFASGGGG